MHSNSRGLKNVFAYLTFLSKYTGVMHPALEPLSTGKTGTCWSRARRGHKNDPRAGAPLL